jgi:hypothetical protein
MHELDFDFLYSDALLRRSSLSIFIGFLDPLTTTLLNGGGNGLTANIFALIFAFMRIVEV